MKVRALLLPIAAALVLLLPPDASARRGKADASQGFEPAIRTTLPSMDKVEKAKALTDEGDMLTRKDQYTEAEAKYSAALKQVPGHMPALIGRAWARMNIGDLKAAARDSLKAMKTNPSSPVAWLVHAYILERQKKPKESLDAVGKALELGSTDKSTLLGSSELLGVLGRYDIQVRVCDEILRIDPGNITALGRRADAKSIMGQNEEALKEYQELLRLKPDSIDTLVGMSNALAELSRQEEALQMLDKALEINPRQRTVLFNKSLLLLKLKRPEESLRVADQALALTPDAQDFQLRRAMALVALHRDGDALSAFNKTLEGNPKNASALLNRALLHSKDGRWPAASQDLQALLAVKPSKFATCNLALVLASAPDDALRDGARAVKLVRSTPALPASPMRQTTLAAALAETGDFKAATQTMREAITLEKSYKKYSAACMRYSQKMFDAFQAGRPWRLDHRDEDYQGCMHAD